MDPTHPLGIEAAVPVSDSLLLSISIAGFVVLATSIYWLFYRGETPPKNDDVDHVNPNSRAHRRIQVREQRRHQNQQRGEEDISRPSCDRSKKQKRRTVSCFPDHQAEERQQAEAAAKRERLEKELDLKEKKRSQEAAAYACFFGPVSVKELSTKRTFDIEQLAMTCGGTKSQIRQRIEELVETKRWAGFFSGDDVNRNLKDSTIDSQTQKEDITPVTPEPRSQFVRLFDSELQTIADKIKERQRVSLQDIAEIIQEVVQDGNAR